MSNINLEDFPKTEKSEWISLAAKQLKNDDPLGQLQWQVEPSILADPYYDQSDLSGLESQISFFQSLPSHEWKLYEVVSVRDEGSANKMALEALEGGCDGIIFLCEKAPKISALLEGIITDICQISFTSSEELPISDEINKLNGFVYSKNHQTAYQSGESEYSVSQIIDVVKNLSSLNYVTRTAFKDFFLEIATVRAIRYLLNHHLSLAPDAVHIHTSIGSHENEEHQWFLNTTAGLASILGGTNSVDFYEAKGNARISRNVGNLIREESGIKEYSDQCGGSFYIESLTHKLIEASKNQLGHA